VDVSEKLEESFLLDRLWCTLREEPQVTKESTLHLLIQILEETQVPYALVGGVAIQIYVPEPRTTLDIDIAVLAREAVPTSYLEARGFQKTGDFRFSQNWQGPDKTRVQFTLDEYAEQTIGSATLVDWQETKIRVVSRLELLRAKIRAATDKERKVLTLLRTFRATGSPNILPPGTPKERVQILQEAMRKTFRDPEFHKEFKKLAGDEAAPLMPEELEKAIKEMPRDREVIDFFKKLSSNDALPAR